MLDRIEASPLVKIEFAGSDRRKAALLRLKKLSPHPISYADAVSFAIMEGSGCGEALSYDHHFRLAGFLHPKA